MADLCPVCEGSGLRVVERADGLRVAQPCECRAARRAVRIIEQARIPKRYAHCTLEDYVPNYGGKNPSLSNALVQSRNYVREYLPGTDVPGLLLTGSIGVGKTHLAVGILQSLIAERGAKGLFFDYRDLLKQVQNSYNRSVEATELEILQPVFDAEVLVLDELGASKPTDWVWDTVAHILNTRYNDRRTTIITTNYANLPPGGGELSGPRAAVREETLGDRIGERMRSRLQEMCVVVEMKGEDFRQTVRRASFA
ncbi:MAG TPA: ATP-binding protein [Bryocella sp.]|nr:ATP-binding protein [Bryocella sp.]